MKRIEYRNVVDKAGWPHGPWCDEPDKIQWQDEATGLACLIIRGPEGALCGYVGVPLGHPLHGIDYGQCPQGEACPERMKYQSWCSHSPDSALKVHGGITFAGGCSDTGRDKWEKWRSQKPELEREAKRSPIGDAARSLKEWAGCWDDYDAWSERARARLICHIPAPGEPDHVWWFGFDCAHAGDFIPSYERKTGWSSMAEYRWGSMAEYRDHTYVADQCHQLARQLKELDPFGRQPQPVTIIVKGASLDVEYWYRELKSRAEFKGDNTQDLVKGPDHRSFKIYPRAVND